MDDLSFAAQRAGAAIAATGSAEAVADFKAALLAHATAESAIYSARLVDRDGKAVVVPDLATFAMATSAVSMNYVASREQLGLSADERAEVEAWLDRLYENYIDSYFVLAGQGSVLDPRGVDLVARGMMVNALIDGNVEQFNAGAKLALTVLSFVREDGSDRFGASRGSRPPINLEPALYYAPFPAHFSTVCETCFSFFQLIGDRLGSWTKTTLCLPTAKVLPLLSSTENSISTYAGETGARILTPTLTSRPMTI